LELPVGQHFTRKRADPREPDREAGAPERALVFYERALATLPPDQTLPYLYDIGLLHETLGSCEEAIGYFDAYLQRAPRGNMAGEARWHVGHCSFQLARETRREGQLTHSMRHLDRVLELGVPANIQDQAWFERGEILVGMGQFDEALIAYRQVLELNPSRTGQLVERAQRRIEQIRFGW
jgi:tetratricopeptide (TPR) repeat protein